MGKLLAFIQKEQSCPHVNFPSKISGLDIISWKCSCTAAVARKLLDGAQIYKTHITGKGLIPPSWQSLHQLTELKLCAGHKNNICISASILLCWKASKAPWRVCHKLLHCIKYHCVISFILKVEVSWEDPWQSFFWSAVSPQLQASYLKLATHMFYLTSWEINLSCWFGLRVPSVEKQEITVFLVSKFFSPSSEWAVVTALSI